MTPQGSQDEQEDRLPPMICGACHMEFYGEYAANAISIHMRTEHNADSPDTNTDTASLPKLTCLNANCPERTGGECTFSLPVGNGNPKNVMGGATPEQLREAIIEKLENYYDDSDEEKADQILALFATFLASIELPEKPVRPHAADSPIAYGFKMAIDQSQAIIDKIVEGLK